MATDSPDDLAILAGGIRAVGLRVVRTRVDNDGRSRERPGDSPGRLPPTIKIELAGDAELVHRLGQALTSTAGESAAAALTAEALAATATARIAQAIHDAGARAVNAVIAPPDASTVALEIETISPAVAGALLAALKSTKPNFDGAAPSEAAATEGADQ